MLIRCIIEMMGAPKEHVVKTLRDYIEKWKTEGIKIKKEHYEEPAEHKKLWSTFAELEIDFKEMDEVMGFCLDALPASIEIIEPEQFHVENRHMTMLLNDMLARVHNSDMLVKNMRSQLTVLDQNVLQVFRNFIRFLIKQKVVKFPDLAKQVGVSEEELKPFLDKMVEENLLRVDGTSYAVHG